MFFLILVKAVVSVVETKRIQWMWGHITCRELKDRALRISDVPRSGKNRWGSPVGPDGTWQNVSRRVVWERKQARKRNPLYLESSTVATGNKATIDHPWHEERGSLLCPLFRLNFLWSLTVLSCAHLRPQVIQTTVVVRNPKVRKDEHCSFGSCVLTAAAGRYDYNNNNSSHAFIQLWSKALYRGGFEPVDLLSDVRATPQDPPLSLRKTHLGGRRVWAVVSSCLMLWLKEWFSIC